MRREASLEGHSELRLVGQALCRHLASHSSQGLDTEAPLVKRRQKPVDLGPDRVDSALCGPVNEDSGADVNSLADYGLRVAAILDPSSNEVGKSTVHRQMVDSDVVF